MTSKSGNNRSTLAASFCLLLCSFAFSMNCRPSLCINSIPGTDSSVFRLIAWMMDKGYMPYRDSFDHKGPLLYLINLLGMRISMHWGTWFVEFIAIFITFVGIYKIARLCCKRMLSCLSVLISSSLLFTFFEYGNLTEEYAMPFIATSLYIYLDYFINCKITRVRLLICGLGLGAVCLLRVNMISVWIIFSCAVLIDCIRNRYAEKLKVFISFFLIGFCTIALPILLWLAVNHSLQAFFDDYILFNILYTSEKGGRALVSAKASSFFTFLRKPLISFSLIVSLYLWITSKKKFLYGTYFIYILCTLFLMSISGMIHLHYGMILVPAISFPTASFYEICMKRKMGRIPAWILTIYMIPFVIFPNWLRSTIHIAEIQATVDTEWHSELKQTISAIIKEHTLEDAKISVYGNWDILYLLSERLPATKYSYQFPIGQVDPSLMDEYFQELEMELPEFIVVLKQYQDENILRFLAEHNYEKFWNASEKVSIYHHLSRY